MVEWRDNVAQRSTKKKLIERYMRLEFSPPIMQYKNSKGRDDPWREEGFKCPDDLHLRYFSRRFTPIHMFYCIRTRQFITLFASS